MSMILADEGISKKQNLESILKFSAPNWVCNQICYHCYRKYCFSQRSYKYRYLVAGAISVERIQTLVLLFLKLLYMTLRFIPPSYHHQGRGDKLYCGDIHCFFETSWRSYH